MRVNYFGYYLENIHTEQKTFFNFKPILRTYTRLNAPLFKNDFNYGDENLYLIHKLNDTYLFVITRDKELIRKIDTNSISVSDIHADLQSGDRIGFASYVLIKEDYVGFASTLMSPKFHVLGDYINELLSKIGYPNWRFVLKPLLHQATRNEALQMSHVGRTKIVVSKENSLARELWSTFSNDEDSDQDIDGFEIIVKPKRGRDIKESVGRLLNNVNDDGLEKLVIKAKEEAASQLTDLYVVGHGAINDNIDKSVEHRIPDHLEAKAQSNHYLRNKLDDFRDDRQIERVDIEALSTYSDPSTWSNHIPDLQLNSGE